MVDLSRLGNVLMGLAIVDAGAASFAVLPGFGIPLGSENEVLDVRVPALLHAKADPKDLLTGSDLYGSSETYASWRGDNRIVYAVPWLWSPQGLGASPMDGELTANLIRIHGDSR